MGVKGRERSPISKVRSLITKAKQTERKAVTEVTAFFVAI